MGNEQASGNYLYSEIPMDGNPASTNVDTIMNNPTDNTVDISLTGLRNRKGNSTQINTSIGTNVPIEMPSTRDKTLQDAKQDAKQQIIPKDKPTVSDIIINTMQNIGLRKLFAIETDISYIKNADDRDTMERLDKKYCKEFSNPIELPDCDYNSPKLSNWCWNVIYWKLFHYISNIQNYDPTVHKEEYLKLIIQFMSGKFFDSAEERMSTLTQKGTMPLQYKHNPALERCMYFRYRNLCYKFIYEIDLDEFPAELKKIAEYEKLAMLVDLK